MTSSFKAAAGSHPHLEAVGVDEAARRLGIGRVSVYKLLNRGRLSNVDIGMKRRLILTSEIDAILRGER